MLACYLLLLSRDMPSLSQIENPSFEFASVAYTADGVELARFGRQNRSWISYDDISAHVKNALISTEDHRFESHWGMDMFRTASAFTQSALGKLGLPFERQGGSTITQQLARNLYNEQIGFAVTVERKLKEMATAVQLERRYSKQEIVEMYLNTVPFRHNAFGIEAAGRTYFGKSAEELDELEAAALIGMLKGTSLYDPVRNPDRSRERRNVVLRQMVRRGHLDRQFYETYRDSLTTTRFRSADVTQSFAPLFRRIRAQLGQRLGTRKRHRRLRRGPAYSHDTGFRPTATGAGGRRGSDGRAAGCRRLRVERSKQSALHPRRRPGGLSGKPLPHGCGKPVGLLLGESPGAA